jgi:hypothetical protein
MCNRATQHIMKSYCSFSFTPFQQSCITTWEWKSGGRFGAKLNVHQDSVHLCYSKVCLLVSTAQLRRTSMRNNRSIIWLRRTRRFMERQADLLRRLWWTNHRSCVGAAFWLLLPWSVRVNACILYCKLSQRPKKILPIECWYAAFFVPNAVADRARRDQLVSRPSSISDHACAVCNACAAFWSIN